MTSVTFFLERRLVPEKDSKVMNLVIAVILEGYEAGEMAIVGLHEQC